jgi:hypothetical protein
MGHPFSSREKHRRNQQAIRVTTFQPWDGCRCQSSSVVSQFLGTVYSAFVQRTSIASSQTSVPLMSKFQIMDSWKRE